MSDAPAAPAPEQGADRPPQPVRKFLVVADDSTEFSAALRFACARARATGGRVAMMRVLEPPVFEQWSGVREEIERQQRAEAEALLQKMAAQVVEATGHPPEFILKERGDVRSALREAVLEDPEIKILVLAAATSGRGPGPLVSAVCKEGVIHHGRKLPVTIVPGDLTDEEIAELA
ncbi:MAG TPA: universal stress protein [Caulobacteraceae bacterium]|jgi:nucleotide-binding universal stress UspA family protein